MITRRRVLRVSASPSRSRSSSRSSSADARPDGRPQASVHRLLLPERRPHAERRQRRLALRRGRRAPAARRPRRAGERRRAPRLPRGEQLRRALVRHRGLPVVDARRHDERREPHKRPELPEVRDVLRPGDRLVGQHVAHPEPPRRLQPARRLGRRSRPRRVHQLRELDRVERAHAPDHEHDERRADVHARVRQREHARGRAGDLPAQAPEEHPRRRHRAVQEPPVDALRGRPHEARRLRPEHPRGRGRDRGGVAVEQLRAARSRRQRRGVLPELPHHAPDRHPGDAVQPHPRRHVHVQRRHRAEPPDERARGAAARLRHNNWGNLIQIVRCRSASSAS